jgi:ATP-dependent exoDNAse (exonuclease V) alpha subunit
MKQQEALAIMHSGASVLLTGAAGTGKTHTLNAFIRQARSLGKSVSVTATTGLAATHLGGNTIHSWAGIGIKNYLPDDHFIKISESRKKIIQNSDVLIIDEISMLHDYRLDMVEAVCREVRGINVTFGGLQVILCGDFYQLPPINREGEPQGGFVTNSKTWQEGNFTVCYLNEQFRQKDDKYYTDILNGIRAGVLARSQLDMLLAKQNEQSGQDIAVTKLLTTNFDTDTINSRHLKQLDTESVEYEMTLSGGKSYQEQLLKSCLAPMLLELKIGAQVMCIKNSPENVM